MARIFKTSPAHDEGGERRFSTETLEFHGDGGVERIVVRDDASGETLVMAADLVLIAAGFVGPELERLGLHGRALRHVARHVVGRGATGASRPSRGRRRSSPAATPFAVRA